MHTFHRGKRKKKRKREMKIKRSPFSFSALIEKCYLLLSFGGFFPPLMFVVVQSDSLLNNFPIFLYICDVAILMWIIPTNKPGTGLSAPETRIYLYWVSGVLPGKTLTLCYVVPFTCFFCHFSLFFSLYPGEKPAHLAKEVCYVCGRGLKYVADVSPCPCWGTRTLLPPIQNDVQKILKPRRTWQNCGLNQN